MKLTNESVRKTYQALCLVFEQDEDDANEEEYAKIFDEYKNLVDKLLASHMEDLSISPEQFEEACKNAQGALSAKFHQTLFEQIWAANDYDIFKRMMIQRNIDLQLQALELLAHRYGLVPESFLPVGTSRNDFLNNEDALLDAIMKRSVDEAEAEKSVANATNGMENYLASSVVQPMSELCLENEHLPTSFAKLPSNHGISSDEIKLRQEYLRKQRDNLLAAKRKERQKQFEDLENSEMLLKRPKSAKALRSYVEDDLSPGEESQNVAFRLSLAKRLKAEVIGK